MPKPNTLDTPTASPAVRKFLAAIGKKGGAAATAAKARSSAENGKLGGRPRKNKAVK
jgi:hypothetical protein